MLKTVSSITNAIGALNFKGTWNASTNTPTIVSGVGVKGDYFVVSVAGSTTIDGISNWGVGDWIAYNGTVWQRVEGGADLNGVNLTVSGNSDMGNIRVASNTISSTDTNGNIVLAPNGTGDVQVDADTFRVGDSNVNATITTNGTGDLILNTNAGTDSGSITIEDAANGNIIIAPNGTGDVYLDADTLRVGDSGANATVQSNGNADLILKTGNATTGSVTLADGANGSLTLALNGTGQVIVNAGAVGTPTIAPTGNTNTGIFFPAADTIAFAEGGAEAMRINSDNQVLFGVTTAFDNVSFLRVQSLGGLSTKIAGTGNTSQMSFFNDNGRVGFISTSGTTTAYNTSSDYRLKHDIQPMTGALAKVAALKPCTYKWNADDSAGQGFIAHELQEIAPDVVTGEKDGDKMQGVDYGRLTPILTAALQEAIAKIKTLEDRIAVLEEK